MTKSTFNSLDTALYTHILISYLFLSVAQFSCLPVGQVEALCKYIIITQLMPSYYLNPVLTTQF